MIDMNRLSRQGEAFVENVYHSHVGNANYDLYLELKLEKGNRYDVHVNMYLVTPILPN